MDVTGKPVSPASARSVALAPGSTDAHGALGAALLDQGLAADALCELERAIELAPHYALAHYNLGNALEMLARFSAAEAAYRRAIELAPEFPAAHNNLGKTLQLERRLDEAVACYRRAIDLDPADLKPMDNLLFAMHYQAGVGREELAAAHREYGRLHGGRWSGPPVDAGIDRDPERQLRLGFVSRDFSRHPVGQFSISVIEHLDQGACETVCYNDRPWADDITDRFRAAAGSWCDVPHLDHDALAARIRADRIDILFDLAGHTAGNRLPVFARRAAPIQITWLGYEGTTGVPAIDHILADHFTIPPEAESDCTEHVLRMPDGFACYAPPLGSPPVAPPPAAGGAAVTFGSFNNQAKITGQVVETWAEILRRVPTSRLLLKYRGMDDAGVAAPLAGEFAAHGIDPARIDFGGVTGYHENLRDYRRLDVALDTFPFSGGATTCDALWMGVPVVTCFGETFASRHGLSHLSNVGLTELIAADLDDYVAKAVALAEDRPRLAALRAALRARMAASPLCNGPRFASNLLAILRGVWQDWCRIQGEKQA